MHIVIVHYHLHPGGVTRVIRSQIHALQQHQPRIAITLLCGENRDDLSFPGVALSVCPNLHYAPDKNYTNDETKQRVYDIEQQLALHLRQGSIIHVHNGTLGKNPFFTIAVFNLAKKGYHVINHLHDFPEDRPANLSFLSRIISLHTTTRMATILYPPLPNYHFVVLTTADQKRVLESMPEHRNHTVHRIPNPAPTVPDNLPTREQCRKDMCQKLHLDPHTTIVTYPIRVISRKNIGELLLLAAIFESQTQFLVTQPPRNPTEMAPYLKWKKCAHNLDLPVLWEVGSICDFSHIMGGSDFCVTTSIREGFGMVYIEPWLYTVPVVGRNLAHTTDDLKAEGLDLFHLYEHFLVPGPKGPVDFPQLPPQQQIDTVTNCCREREFKKEVLRLNSFLRSIFTHDYANSILKNACIIRNHYSEQCYGRTLFSLYREALEKHPPA